MAADRRVGRWVSAPSCRTQLCPPSRPWRCLHRCRALVGSTISLLVGSASLLLVSAALLLPAREDRSGGATGIRAAATGSSSGTPGLLVLLRERRGILPTGPELP